MESLGEVLRRRRTEIGMSQADLAEAAGVHLRQVRRYESGEQQPVLPVAVRLADALGLTMNELAGRTTTPLTLTGRWWAAWQTWNEGQEMVATQPVEMEQHGLTVRIRALERSQENVHGGYLWAGELRVWENHVLMGWYVAEDQNVRSKGTFFFVLHPQGNLMEGSWTGMSYDGPILSGWAAIAQARDQAESVVERLKSQGATAGRA
jgi:transcriptional regulator with XRE-family HTH domain